MITNLTISEFHLREEEEGDKIVIPCVHHKTGTQGIAQLVVTNDIEDVLVYYYRLKIVATEEGNKDKFFLAYNGGAYTQVYRKLKEGLSVGNIQPPLPSDYRVVVSSEARRFLGDKERRNLVKHLSHSMRTSELYYEVMNAKDAATAHTSIQTLSLNRRWSRNEISLLTDHWPLSESPPTLKDCKDFIELSGMARAAKDIFYKWQQLNTQLN